MLSMLLKDTNARWIIGLIIVAYLMYQNGMLNTSPPAGNTLLQGIPGL